MADPFGISFAPTDQNAQVRGDGQRGTSPVQTAIQTLSLRVPHIAGAGAIAPQPLLESGGSAGLGGSMNPNAASILELLKRLFGGSGAPVNGVPGQEPRSPNVYGDPGGGQSGIPGGPEQRTHPIPFPGGLPNPNIIPGNIGGNQNPFPDPETFAPSPQSPLMGGPPQRNKQY